MGGTDVSELIGPDPAATACAAAAGAAAAGAAAIGICALLLVAAAPLGLILIVFPCTALFAAAHGLGRAAGAFSARRDYRLAGEAVKGGAVSPGWVVRGALMRGIAIVDEANRQVYVNGRLCGFPEIDEVRGQTEGNTGWVEFRLFDGWRGRVFLDDAEAVQGAFLRLAAAVGAGESA